MALRRACAAACAAGAAARRRYAGGVARGVAGGVSGGVAGGLHGGGLGHAGPVAGVVPMVLEKTRGGERAFDIYSRLLKEGIVFVNGPIDDGVSALVVAQLLFLEAEAPGRAINVYINSPGGVVSSGLAIYDTMQYVRADVATLCVGQACSMASLLLAAGRPGMRRALPNARVMLHQPSGGASGQASDIAIHANEILSVRRRLNGLYAVHTGRGEGEVGERLERDHFMSAEDAREFGIVDEVVARRGEGEGEEEGRAVAASE